MTMTIKEIAVLSKLSVPTIKRHMGEGRLPFSQTIENGRTVNRVTDEDYQAWAASLGQEGAAPIIDISEARRMMAEGASKADVARHYGVTWGAVYRRFKRAEKRDQA